MQIKFSTFLCFNYVFKLGVSFHLLSVDCKRVRIFTSSKLMLLFSYFEYSFRISILAEVNWNHWTIFTSLLTLVLIRDLILNSLLWL